MTDSLWLTAAALFALLSMGWLALSLKSHWQQVYPDQELNRRQGHLRIAGASFLLLSAVCCFEADHPSMAALVWVMIMAMAAVVVGMTLSRNPRFLRTICFRVFIEES